MSEAARQMPANEDTSSQPKTFTAKAFAATECDLAARAFHASRAALHARKTSRSKFFTAASATPICTRRATNGRRSCPPSIPCVPGHEIVGRVVKVGSAVKKFKEGDIAAVGCMVDSCRTCANCRAGEEQYCEERPDPHLQRPGQDSRRRHLRRLLGEHRGRRSLRPARVQQTGPCRHRAAALRRASPPIRRCATGKSARDKRSASSASAASGTWA